MLSMLGAGTSSTRFSQHHQTTMLETSRNICFRLSKPNDTFGCEMTKHCQVCALPHGSARLSSSTGHDRLLEAVQCAHVCAHPLDATPCTTTAAVAAHTPAMSQHWIYINSPGYRRFVEATKSKRWLLWGTTLALGGLGTLAANVVMNTTNPNMAEEGYKSKDAELAKLPMHAQVHCDVFKLKLLAQQHRSYVWGLLLMQHQLQQQCSNCRCLCGLRNVVIWQLCAEWCSVVGLGLQVTARAQRDQLRAMILDVTEGRDKARYKDLLE